MGTAVRKRWRRTRRSTKPTFAKAEQRGIICTGRHCPLFFWEYLRPTASRAAIGIVFSSVKRANRSICAWKHLVYETWSLPSPSPQLLPRSCYAVHSFRAGRCSPAEPSTMADFPLPMSEAFLGTLDNPAISQSYRKAVIRPAPSEFTVELYSPKKQGANFHYGMRVIPSEVPSSPVQSSARSSRSSKSAKYKEYDIFRRWEDCLDFQRTLELEYESISRRRRKGQPAFNHHAKNTLYPSQRAASFDSLPAGPDPSSIATDVHEYIPKLSKKSTLFRTNNTTVSQRGEEFKAMIEALLDENAHSTIQELRTVPLVRDFFALWRRDKEAERRSMKASAVMTAPPLPENTKAVSSPPGVNVPKKSPTLDHLADFLHTPNPVPKSPKPPARNSFAPPRNSAIRPHTANPGGETSFQNMRPLISHPFNANYDNQFHASPVNSYLTPPAGAHRPGRSSTVPNLENGFIGGRMEPLSDSESRAKEPLLLRSIRDNNGVHRVPGRQVSTPELPRSNQLERRSSRDLLSRNVDAKVPANVVVPMPVFMLSQRTVSQPGGVRRATLRETAEESVDQQPKPTRDFPFDHPPESPPVTPGVAGVGVGRTGGRHLSSLAIMDPEMYQTLSAQQTQQQAPWTPPTPMGVEASPVVPRARKTPPIIDSGNRSARFFVDDPTAGMVDVAGGPPPRSPISALMGMESPYEYISQFEQVAGTRHAHAMKLGKPPAGRAPPPTKPHLDISDHGHNYSVSTTSGASVPGFSSPNATSSISSQGSPLSSTNAQRYRSRASLGSVAEQRRLSLDSLVASDFELPYLSRNISTPQFTQKNKSADGVYTALNNLSAPSSTALLRGRASYSSQETDSTGFGLEDNSSSYAPARLPPSKAAVIATKTSPPPRPPRSALRNSSQFSAGVIHRLNESLAASQLQGEPAGDSHEFIDSYFTTPQLPHAALDPPTPTHMAQNPRESANSTLANIAQYYLNDKHESTLQPISPSGTDFATASLPPTPINGTFDSQGFNAPILRNPSQNPASSNVGVVSIKAVHAQSETIVLFKISRHGTTLSDLRSKIIRKFRETEGLDLPGFILKYLPPRSDHGFIPNPTGRKRSTSVTSTSDISVLSSLDTESEWQRALAGSNKIIIRIL